MRFGNQPHSAIRGNDQPAATLRYSARVNANTRGALSASKRPNAATRGGGQPSMTITGGHDTQNRRWDDGRPLSLTEAAVLQTFPRDYPWQGNKGQRHQQVGDAMPPLLAVAVLGHMLGIDGWQDLCRDHFDDEANRG